MGGAYENIIRRAGWQCCGAIRAKKDSGSARQGETTNTRKRAATRIALTYLFRQWGWEAVRSFFTELKVF
jgi:hypothetical protein